MPINLREADRDQLFLLPPSVADWLPENHLAFFVLDVVSELDLSAFYSEYREDGRGGAAYDPALVLAVLFYAYCVGERSSRRIERRLVEDVAFRVVGANQLLDHATLARFRRRHAEAIAELFGQVLGLCVKEGLVETKVISIDGTKMEANASAWANRTRRQLADEILADAERQDAAEDEHFGERRGGELPATWARRDDRRARVREALRQLDEHGAADFESHLAERAAREQATGRKIPGRKPTPSSNKAKERLANPTDPDSRMLRARNRFLQGYNAQAAVSTAEVVVAAEVTNAANDSTMFAPMVRATTENLARTDAEPVGTFVADTGYWSVDNVTLDTDAELLITPMPATRGISDPDDPRIQGRAEVLEPVIAGELTTKDAAVEMGDSQNWATQLLADHHRGRADPAVLRNQMLDRLATDEGRRAYATRKVTTEPVFGNIKANLHHRRFSGRGMQAARSEWRLICSVHNLLKVRNHRLAVA
ncbi:MAG: IS1182 family transposase [Acidimicrobiales bacterium]